MDIYNGDIISMVSSPSFNPNSFIHGINQNEWDGLLNNRDKPMINKAISGLYPPGSTIKTLTALSALENDVVSSKLLLRCKGFIDLHGERFHCWKKKGHGVVGMRTALKQSCDVYFYEVARKLGIDRLAATARKFGLGKKVLQDYKEEKAGVVPTTKWKIKELGKNWYIGETLHSGIGQGYFLTTPLQLSLMTAQIANGGFKIKPRILIDENDQDSDLQKFLNYKDATPGNVMSLSDKIFNFDLQPLFRNQENINLIKEAMFAATNEIGGTSYRSRHKNKNFMFAGKTGSSQIKRFTPEQREAEVKQEDISYLDRDHAWFVAFAPVSEPRYAISVLVEHGGSGSAAAAPIAKEIIKKVLERHQTRSSYENRKVENL
jgi:penicillin-binding protein 2